MLMCDFWFMVYYWSWKHLFSRANSVLKTFSGHAWTCTYLVFICMWYDVYRSYKPDDFWNSLEQLGNCCLVFACVMFGKKCIMDFFINALTLPCSVLLGSIHVWQSVCRCESFLPLFALIGVQRKNDGKVQVMSCIHFHSLCYIY